MKMKAAYQNLWGAAEAVLREKRVAVNTDVKTQEGAQTSYPSFHLKKLDKEQHIKPSANRKKQTTEIKIEINEVENRKIMGKIIQPKRG